MIPRDLDNVLLYKHKTMGIIAPRPIARGCTGGGRALAASAMQTATGTYLGAYNVFALDLHAAPGWTLHVSTAASFTATAPTAITLSTVVFNPDRDAEGQELALQHTRVNVGPDGVVPCSLVLDCLVPRDDTIVLVYITKDHVDITVTSTVTTSLMAISTDPCCPLGSVSAAAKTFDVSATSDADIELGRTDLDLTGARLWQVAFATYVAGLSSTGAGAMGVRARLQTPEGRIVASTNTGATTLPESLLTNALPSTVATLVPGGVYTLIADADVTGTALQLTGGVTAAAAAMAPVTRAPARTFVIHGVSVFAGITAVASLPLDLTGHGGWALTASAQITIAATSGSLEVTLRLRLMDPDDNLDAEGTVNATVGTSSVSLSPVVGVESALRSGKYTLVLLVASNAEATVYEGGLMSAFAAPVA